MFSAVRRRCSKIEWKGALGKRQPNAGKKMAIQMEESAAGVTTNSPPMSSARCVATPANTAQTAGRRPAHSGVFALALLALAFALRRPAVWAGFAGLSSPLALGSGGAVGRTAPAGFSLWDAL